ncbi:MAG: hypothetical protein QG646_1478 [Euryarchaeota archaeon]|nr:hypothetical protein [Euryarchaeota archaeon]
MRNIDNFFPIALVFVFLFFSASIASAKEITVDDNPGADFTFIQAAINASSPGDIIIVKPGTYEENINIEKNITIISESGNPSNTIIKSRNGSDDALRIWSNGVSIQGFSINGAKYAGIHLFGVNDCHITNNNLSNNGCGIDLYMFSSGNTLVYNQISDSVTGISLGDSLLNSLSNNSFLNCSNAISLFDSCNNTLKNNLISNNIEGISLIGESNSNTITGNIINSNKGTGLHLYDTYGNLIYNNYFNNTENAALDEFEPVLSTNIWNISKTASTNIVRGPYIGGNFWANPDRTGYSQTSSDSNKDGISDLSYNFIEDEFDYLPLVSLYNPEKPVFPIIAQYGMNSSLDIIIVKASSELPEADFNADPIIGNVPLSVRFTDISKNATEWHWDFDDGNTSTTQDPVNIFSQAGKYVVNLTVSNENGKNSTTKEITVNKALTEEKIYPVADFEAYPTNGNAPLSVLFTDRSKNAISHSWDFNNDGVADNNNPNPIHVYTIPGKYTVNLTVANDNGTNSKTLDITVNEIINSEKVLPEANFNAVPASGNAPLSVQFSDTSKNATEWHWNLDDGNVSTDRNLVHTFYTDGRYTVNLTVSNENGSNSKTMEITVNEAPIDENNLPVANFDAYPSSGNAPLSVRFTDLSQNAITRSWDFYNDGITDDDTETPIYVYPFPGVYTVNLTVSNENGMNSKTMTISVTEVNNEEKTLPTPDFSAVPASGNAPLSVQFTDLSKNATALSWNFGDGNTSASNNLVHTFYTAGKYTVNLTVTNENGSNSKTMEITVDKALSEEKVFPVANFNANPTSGNAPLSVQFTDLSQNAVSRSWDLNNDGTAESGEASPVYTYNDPGTYTAKLIVSNSNGTANKSAIINVLDGNSGGSSSGGSSSGGSSSSSGGSGGGGAGGSPELQSNVETKELSQTFVASGSSVRFDFPRNATSVLYITFNSRKTAGKTTTIVEMLKGKSTLVSQLPSAEVYKSLNIWVGNSGFATSGNIENSVICFKVAKSWMREKNVNQSSITLQRYSDNKWNSLPISLLGEDSSYFYFTAQTPGFSPFAITAGMITKEIVSKTQPTSDAKTQPGANVVNAVQNNTSNTIQASGPKSEQKSEKGKSSNLPVFAMVCMIALFLVTFLFRLDKK